MWKIGKVEINFTGRLCGSIPLKKEIVDSWLTSRMPKNKPEEGKSIEEIKAEIIESIEEVEEKVTLGFQMENKHYVVRGGTWKAHLKDCGNQIKDIFKPEIKALRSKIANKVFIDEYFISILKDGAPVTEHSGEFDQPVHVITPQGPRNALKTIRYIDRPTLFFTLKLLPDKEIKESVIEKIFEYGTIHGYAGERSMGEGRYQFNIIWEDGKDDEA